MIEDVEAGKVWEALKADPGAQLCDVRTDAEWNFVGLPDLQEIGREPVAHPMAGLPQHAAERRLCGSSPASGTCARDPDLFHLPQRRTQPCGGPGGRGRRVQEASTTSLRASRDRPMRTAIAALYQAGRPPGCPGGSVEEVPAMTNPDLVALWEAPLPLRVRDPRCRCHDGYDG